MKKTYLLSVVFSFLLLVANAQNVPHGMNYQAVARDKHGELLANQTLTLKVSLVTQQPAENYYTEIQRVATNQFGLFTLVIGKGSTLSGDFYQVPWSTKEIWMETSIKDEASTDFTLISSTKLLTVPYAFHAETAGSLSGANNYADPYGSGNAIQSTPAPGNSWNMPGN